LSTPYECYGNLFSTLEHVAQELMKREMKIDVLEEERCQRIRLSMTRRPLNGLFRRAVQCRAQSVVSRLLERSHPNKVSMKKKRKKGLKGGREKNLI